MSGDLRISDISAGYRGRPVVRNLTLQPIAAGETVALVGPNAAGKSTLLRALAGLLPATGSVTLDGRELIGLPLAERARLVSYMPQALPEGVALTVLETVIGALQASPTGERTASSEEAAARAVKVLERIGIAHLAMEPIDRLSGGQRQLCGLAQALVRSPRLLLLDEPTSALDLAFALRVLKLVRALAEEDSMTAILVLHDLQAAAKAADRVVVLAHGDVAAEGPPGEAITPGLLADVWQVSARVDRCERGAIRIMVDDIV